MRTTTLQLREIERYVQAASQLRNGKKHLLEQLAQVKNYYDYHLLLWRISYLMRHLEEMDFPNKSEMRKSLDFLAYYLIKYRQIKPEQCRYLGKTAESLFVKAQNLYTKSKVKVYSYEFSRLGIYKDKILSILPFSLMCGLFISSVVGGATGILIASVAASAGLLVPPIIPVVIAVAAIMATLLAVALCLHLVHLYKVNKELNQLSVEFEDNLSLGFEYKLDLGEELKLSKEEHRAQKNTKKDLERAYLEHFSPQQKEERTQIKLNFFQSAKAKHISCPLEALSNPLFN